LSARVVESDLVQTLILIKMTEYTCLNCSRQVKDISKTACPYCNCRILIKKELAIVREMEAI